MFNRIVFSMILGLGLLTAGSVTSAATKTEDDPNLIQKMVEHRLMKHDLLENNQIQVVVTDHTITLNGNVLTLAYRKQAEKDAHVDEQYRVQDNLALKESSLSDKEITQKVDKVIYRNVFYSVFDWYTADVKDGLVTLKGWVHEPWRKEDVENVVEKVVGVKKIKNEIENSFGPGSIGVKAARLIYNDPMFWRYAGTYDPPVHIVVNNGVVYLEGFVTSQVEKSWAANLVEFYTDAARVINDLRVVSPDKNAS